MQEDHANQLLEQEDDFKNEMVADSDVFDQRPSSSRVKKVLIWNPKRQEFDMSEEDKRELREAHIKSDHLW